MTESDIISYALAYDPQPFHIDVEAASKSAYGGLIASGQHTFGVGWRMFLQEGLFKACSMGSPGVDELRWTAPVRPGDTISIPKPKLWRNDPRGRSPIAAFCAWVTVW